MAKRKIVFVCSANTCRSAVAEAILREYGGEKYEVSSAGLFAVKDESMAPECASALSDMFGRLVYAGSHSARKLTEEIMSENDEIVAVSEGYAALIRAFFPSYAEKVTAFPGEGIRDISRLSDAELARAVAEIRDAVFAMFLPDGTKN